MPQATHIAVTGASGLIGRALSRAAAARYRITPLVRHPPGPGQVRWDPAAPSDLNALGPVDAVIHLAGENLAAHRWTRRRRAAILSSRRDATANLVASLLRLPTPPRVLVTASAVGIYGDRGDELLTEASDPGTGFLAEVARGWEDAATLATAAGIRVVRLRLGVVLTPDGGALGRMLLPFRLGLGGAFGSGRQWMSWISLDDALAVITFAIETGSLAGPVNVTAPSPVTNGDFARALAAALHRPGWLRIPAPALRLLLGELADATLLASQRAVPARLTTEGFRFQYPELQPALAHLLG